MRRNPAKSLNYKTISAKVNLLLFLYFLQHEVWLDFETKSIDILHFLLRLLNSQIILESWQLARKGLFLRKTFLLYYLVTQLITKDKNS